MSTPYEACEARLFIGDQEVPVHSVEWTEPPVLRMDLGSFLAAWDEAQNLMVPTFKHLAQTVTEAYETIQRFARAFGIPPCRLGFGPCFCHPAPFPAARDYRRRTKHRNRRRR